jgi:hypothetical protein
MNPVSDIKRFVLRALLRLNGLPWPDALLEEAVKQAVLPQPLLSEVHQAKRELEAGGFIQGRRDELDGEVTWTLTVKGQHKAGQLGEP